MGGRGVENMGRVGCLGRVRDWGGEGQRKGRRGYREDGKDMGLGRGGELGGWEGWGSCGGRARGKCVGREGGESSKIGGL